MTEELLEFMGEETREAQVLRASPAAKHELARGAPHRAEPGASSLEELAFLFDEFCFTCSY